MLLSPVFGTSIHGRGSLAVPKLVSLINSKHLSGVALANAFSSYAVGLVSFYTNTFTNTMQPFIHTATVETRLFSFSCNTSV